MEDNLLNAVSKLNINSGNAESYFNWIDNDKFENSAISKIIEIIENRFLELSEQENKEITLKYSSTELIADKGTQAYSYLLINKIVKARAALADGRNLIQICSNKSLVDQDRLAGMDYVFDCLELYIDLKYEEQENNSELKQEWEKLPQNPKSQAVILAFKFYFYRQLRAYPEEHLGIAEEMIRLDPDYYEWHICKATILRFSRNTEWFDSEKIFDATKFEPEMTEIILAKSLASPNHPQCMLAYCQLLAELNKRTKRKFQDWQTPLKCGAHEITKLEDLVKFLKEESLKILAVYDISVRANLTIADFFLKLLPYKHIDLEFGKSCLQKALEIQPRSSKVNHRFAQFYLVTATDREGIAIAEKYCSQAVKHDSRNFPAQAELIQILLGEPKKNEAKLNKIFDIHLNGSCIPLSKRNRSDLHFFKGLMLQSISGFEKEATENWIIAQQITNPIFYFYNLTFTHNRYKWPLQQFSILKLRETVKRAMSEPDFSNGKTEALVNLLKTLDKAQEREIVQLQYLKTQGERGLIYVGRGRGARGHDYRGRTGAFNFRDGSNPNNLFQGLHQGPGNSQNANQGYYKGNDYYPGRDNGSGSSENSWRDNDLQFGEGWRGDRGSNTNSWRDN